MSKQDSGSYSKDVYTLYSNDDLADERMRSDSKLKEETVKFKMDIECSTNFAEYCLNGFFQSIKKEKKWGHIFSDIGQLREPQANFEPPTEQPSLPPDEYQEFNQEDIKTTSRWKSKILLSAFLMILICVSALAVQAYFANQNRQLYKLNRHEKLKTNLELYQDILDNNLDNLLKNLDDLTAINRFRSAHPEIISMPAIARFKRGKDSVEKSKATVEFLWRVKYLFDSWIERPEDLPEGARPTGKDIAQFETIWTDTKTILDQIDVSKQNLLIY